VNVQTNLYKCFLTTSWAIGSQEGVVGIIHQEGIYDDPKGATLREQVYGRLVLRCQFKNDLALFDISNQRLFGFSISYASHRGQPRFTFLGNLFHPSTIDGSFEHDGHGAVPGIKTEEDTWDIRPHRSRRIAVHRERLELFARLYDEPGTPPEQARLPVVHSEEIVRVLEKFAAQPRKLGDLEG